MRIGINARLFSFDQFTGIARSVKEIVICWMLEHPEHEYYLFTNKPLKLDISFPDNWKIICEPCFVNKGFLWETFKLPHLIKKVGLDVFWGTDFSLPPTINGIKYFVTIYDLAAFKVKGVTAYKNLIRLRIVERNACKRATKVIAISEATANDINEVFGIDKEKIIVSYCGGLPGKYEKNDWKEKEVNPSLRFTEDFFLFISTIEPRKNIVTIIKAYEKYVDVTKSDAKLVLAGKIGWLCDDILKTAEESQYSDRIIMPGFISDTDKAYLLSNAKAFLYPSLYEGFGIPILEAFEYDLPVITARVSSMPEVGGEAAFYIDDPYDVDALTKQMIEVCNIGPEEMVGVKQRIAEQREKFSWTKNANEIMELFEQEAK